MEEKVARFEYGRDCIAKERHESKVGNSVVISNALVHIWAFKSLI